jgi:CDP-diacylglycerol--glycerol-3-phosphate 3-phosphatidyltransferase
VTLANWITIGRLVLIPVFLVLIMMYRQEEPWLRLAALGTFVVASLSDALDGFVARAYNQKTRLGAVLDPLADKLMLNLSFVFLAANDQFETSVPAWVPVIIISRDAIIVLGFYLLNEFYGPIQPRPRILGKLTTALQMSAVVTVLLQWNYAYYLLMTMLVITVISFFDYLYVGVRQIGNEDNA